MRTVDQRADPNRNWFAKLRNDAALAGRLFGMAVFYWTAGRKMRAAYRRCEQRGEIFYVDDDPAESERRLR